MASKEAGWADPLRTVPVQSQGPWLPLESNPELLNDAGRRWGLPDGYHFEEVLGMDPMLLSMVSAPAVAVVLLFPCTEKIYSHRLKQDLQLQASGKTRDAVEPGIFFLTQHAEFGNACGTIAAVHAITNGCSTTLQPSTPIGTFAAANTGQPPSVVGRALLDCEPLKSSSDAVAQSAEAQTACPSRDGPDLDHHFVAFVRSPTGRLLELDGTKRCPVDHGPVSSLESLLVDAAAAVQSQFMAVEPDSIEFSLMALVKSSA